MALRFLIDECLTTRLVKIANECGFEAYHVAHHGWSKLKDPALFKIIQRENFTFVTNNRDDFINLVKTVDLHAGLIVILPSVVRDEQISLFRKALAYGGGLSDMVNKVLEIDKNEKVRIYDLPNWND